MAISNDYNKIVLAYDIDIFFLHIKK